MSDFDDNKQPGDAQAAGDQSGAQGQKADNGFTYQPPMREETDISDMEPQAAREYVLAYIQTLKETQLAITKVKEEAALWQNRIQLAQQQNRSDLKAAAETKKAELDAKLAMLTGEEQDLLDKVSVLKENLRRLKGKFQYSIDTEQLLASMEMLVGERDTLKDKFKEQDAETELEKLKAKLQQEKGGAS